MTNVQIRTVEETALSAANFLQNLGPGDLAELRRMSILDSGAPAYWRLAARHSQTIRNNHDIWMPFVRILAILIAKGDPKNRHSLHDRTRRLGTVLCDGGNPDWPDELSIRPVFSERRLAQLMSARARQRRILLERAIRVLARTRRPESGINVVDIAWWLLGSDWKKSARVLAEQYYARLDRAEHHHRNAEENASL